MGQRTQVFVQTKDLEGNVRNYFYHQQWGFGSGLFNRFVNLYNKLTMLNTYSVLKEPFDVGEIFSEDLDLFKEAKENEWDLYGFKNKLAPWSVLCNEFFNQDNDDGFLVIRLNSTEFPYDFSRVQAGFYTRDLDYVSPIEYLEEYKYDVGEKYLTYAKAFVNYIEGDLDEDDKVFKDVLRNWSE